MSVLSALFDNKTYNLEQAFHAKDITSPQMNRAIRAWFDLYYEESSNPEEDNCQRLPAAVVNKLYKAVFSEYHVTVTARGPKGAFVNGLVEELGRIKKKAMQAALVGGECLIKPILSEKGIRFAVVRRDCYIPLARDGGGRITSVGMAEYTVFGGKHYTLLERRTVDSKGFLTIENKLYCSESPGTLGMEVPLSSLDKYAALQPSATLPEPLYNLGMAQMKTPMMNTVDGSEDGVSVYAAAVGLIQNINRNEWLLNNEFDNGQSRIIASADMVTSDSQGRKRLSDRLFMGVDDDPESVGVTIFSPTLREQSYLNRKQEYLRNIENLIGLKRGILSEVEAAERTATEITSSAGDYNLTIIDFQAMWENVVFELLATSDRLGQMYHLCDSAKFDPYTDLAIDWGDGVLYNREKVWQEYVNMVGQGLLKPELALAWYFNLPHDTPQDLEKIRAEYMPEMEELMGSE